MILRNVIHHDRDSNGAATTWDIELKGGRVESARPSGANQDMPSHLLLPPLCHPHLHLDKAYILTCNHAASSADYPDYSDLSLKSGSFDEALTNTSRAKQRYTADDLYLRGSQLLATSYVQGVTALRAFVELDHVTGALPLTTALRLKQDFGHLLELQICVFAQDPIFSTTHAQANRSVVTEALAQHLSSDVVGALGTTPYVEASREASLANIEWAITTALTNKLHLDFHLDYNLDSSPRPLILSVIDLLEKHEWAKRADKSKTIVLGHCTQLTVVDDAERKTIASAILSSKLPIHFIGLPTSDLFMMGRPSTETRSSHHRPRGTIHVPSMIRDLGVSACLGVNNVGNAFTPFGTGDPLQLASWAVGIYQAGTDDDAALLYDCVSRRARQAIGLGIAQNDILCPGISLRGMLLLKTPELISVPAVDSRSAMTVVNRRRLTVKDVVWDPPESSLRSIIL
ncbi:hypothetical protein GGR57DRAFT_492414 [Xylariaceae sp. FL1272]|nr:hypothetical protein GGR57DRAFT_492414 [Xylariaceae sp. FL1272]